MRILLMGPVHRQKEFLKQKEPYPFLRSQGQQSWVNALTELGHDVTVFRYTDSELLPQIVQAYSSEFFYHNFPRWYARWRRLKDTLFYYSLDNKLKNKRLWKTAQQAKPHLLFISGGISSVFPETILAIKKTYRCSVFLFSGINPLVGASRLEKILVKEGIVDLVLENDEGYAALWRKTGAKKAIVLPISSVDPTLHKKMRLSHDEKNAYASDVCFVGTVTPDRQEALKQLTGFSLKIWGDVPQETGLDQALRPYYYGEAFGEKMIKIFNAAKIVLNFQPADMTHGGNMRTFEITGCGAFELVDKVDKRWFTTGKEVVLFKDLHDLNDKIVYYLKHSSEREMVADAGYKKAHGFHTYTHHFARLFSEYVS